MKYWLGCGQHPQESQEMLLLFSSEKAAPEKKGKIHWV